MNSWQLNKGEARVLSKINAAGLDCCLIYLTATGIEKGILDATAPFRELLCTNGIHDYSSQAQGPNAKEIYKCTFFVKGRAIDSKISCYRPLTKKGDPRIWPYGLKKIAKGDQVLAAFAVARELFFINISDDAMIHMNLSAEEQFVQEGAAVDNNEFNQFLESLAVQYNAASSELLFKLRQISRAGPMRAVGHGDTAIGRTIETRLGIDINSSPLPDFKGIEIKSSRTASNVRSNLFAKVADWDISRFKSSKEILEALGYERQSENCRKLYCTVSTLKANSQGLIFDLDMDLARLDELVMRHGQKEPLCAWRLATLHDKLHQKHKETFWINASQLTVDGENHFELISIKHTRRPSTNQFDRLLECGEITMDHLIKRDNKTGRCREKGPLFKIRESSIDELFLGQPQVYGLN